MPSKKSEEQFVEVLQGAGLSKAETAALTRLVRHDGAVRVSDIARTARLNRTTLYATMKALLTKGLVSSSERNGVLYFEAAPPRLLVSYLERRREALTESVRTMKKLVAELERAKEGVERYRPAIRFFDGIEGIKQVYEDLIRNNKEKVVYGFTGAHALLNVMGYDWGDRIVAKRAKAGVEWLALAVEGEYARQMAHHDREQLRKTKFLPRSCRFDIELIAYDDKAAIISFAEDYPWAMIITDRKIAETVKTLFNHISASLGTSEARATSFPQSPAA